MASALYNIFKQNLLGTVGGRLATATIQAYLVDDADYTFAASDAVLADLDVASRVAGPVTITNPTIVDGVFDCDDFVFPSVTGDPSEVIVFHDSTNDVLIAYTDGLTLTPNGNNINVTVHASGVFAL